MCVRFGMVDVRNGTRGDRALMAIAARRHGVVTLAELEAAGLGRGAVAHRVAEGRLRRLHRGVYLVGPLHGPRTKEVAAVLACGESAVLSHGSAAALWGMVPVWRGVPHVTVVGGQPRPSGVRVHRVRRLHVPDVARREGVPVTAPGRTLLDLATVLPQSDLDRAVEEAQVQRLVSRATLTALLARSRGHRGVGALGAALLSEPALTRSEAEARMLAMIRSADLPAPRTNASLHGHEVDLLWPDQRLVLEIDGFAFHSTREAFERDRRRDAQLHAHGYRVMRVTWRQIVEEPEAVIARLAAALSLPPASGPSAPRSRPWTAAR
jgi:very-short-patch-repair endonuclease